MEVDDDNLGLVITDVRSLQPDEVNLSLKEEDDLLHCCFCTYRSFSRISVENHLKIDHICSVCQDVFKNKEDLLSHLKTNHTQQNCLPLKQVHVNTENNVPKKSKRRTRQKPVMMPMSEIEKLVRSSSQKEKTSGQNQSRILEPCNQIPKPSTQKIVSEQLHDPADKLEVADENEFDTEDTLSISDREDTLSISDHEDLEERIDNFNRLNIHETENNRDEMLPAVKDIDHDSSNMEASIMKDIDSLLMSIDQEDREEESESKKVSPFKDKVKKVSPFKTTEKGCIKIRYENKIPVLCLKKHENQAQEVTKEIRLENLQNINFNVDDSNRGPQIDLPARDDRGEAVNCFSDKLADEEFTQIESCFEIIPMRLDTMTKQRNFDNFSDKDRVDNFKDKFSSGKQFSKTNCPPLNKDVSTELDSIASSQLHNDTNITNVNNFAAQQSVCEFILSEKDGFFKTTVDDSYCELITNEALLNTNKSPSETEIIASPQSAKNILDEETSAISIKTTGIKSNCEIITNEALLDANEGQSQLEIIASQPAKNNLDKQTSAMNIPTKKENSVLDSLKENELNNNILNESYKGIHEVQPCSPLKEVLIVPCSSTITSNSFVALDTEEVTIITSSDDTLTTMIMPEQEETFESMILNPSKRVEVQRIQAPADIFYKYVEKNVDGFESCDDESSCPEFVKPVIENGMIVNSNAGEQNVIKAEADIDSISGSIIPRFVFPQDEVLDDDCLKLKGISMKVINESVSIGNFVDEFVPTSLSNNQCIDYRDGNVRKKRKSSVSKDIKRSEKKKKITLPKTKSNKHIDIKLSKVHDNSYNPYAKQTKTFRRRHSKDDIKVKEEVEFSLEEEIKANKISSLQHPYCNICLLIQEHCQEKGISELPDSVQIPHQSELWMPAYSKSDIKLKTSELMKCKDCHLVVHSSCYKSEFVSGKCDRCLHRHQNPDSVVICHICNGKTGALRNFKGIFYHIRCYLLIPELVNQQHMDLSLIDKKRYNLSCDLCDQVGIEPAVHCQASLKCMVAFHLSCAFKDNIDCVLNEKGHPIFRCFFCLEMFKLKLIETGSMSRFKQDLIVGEKVKILNHPGIKQGIVTEVLWETVYAVAFDDGTTCDHVQQDDVIFPEGMKEKVNTRVTILWEDEKYSGIFQKKNFIPFYKVQIKKDKSVIEVDRKDILKL